MSSRDVGQLGASGLHSPPEFGDPESQLSPILGRGSRPPSVAAFDAAKEAGIFFKRIPEQTGRDYRRFSIQAAELTQKERDAVAMLRKAVELRNKWVYVRDVPEWKDFDDRRHYRASTCPGSEGSPPFVVSKSRNLELPFDPFRPDMSYASNHQFRWVDGLVQIDAEPLPANMSYRSFVQDLGELSIIMNDPETRSFCWRRLELLRERFNIYQLLNVDEEQLSQKRFPHRDFYNVYKIDTHVHHSSLANQKELLNFIKDKLNNSGDDVVIKRNGEEQTLSEVFRSLDLSADDLSVDTLDVHAGNATYFRFDRFNLKYNPIGQSHLREIFLKTDNHTGGQYLADLTLKVLADQQNIKYQLSEYRISIYGRRLDEWDKLGEWFQRHKICSPVARWLIQVPRLYPSYCGPNGLQCFQEMLANIFNPLFEVTIDPESHPDVAALLQQVVGFDSVDDESLPPGNETLRTAMPPADWRTSENPPYSYQQYYLQSNLAILNKLRESKGLNTLSFRPHAGEAGPLEHVACTFLLANGINHGLKLKESPVLQYLYYITQIGIAMSPLSNAALFCEYIKNPCIEYFCKGLNVSLSTDDPLQFAYTREPLMEEYSVFASVFRCSNTDLCELARNSVLQSGFESVMKQRFLGKGWYRTGCVGNEPQLSNVPNMRLRYRNDTLLDELMLLWEVRKSSELPKHLHVLPTWHERCH